MTLNEKLFKVCGGYLRDVLLEENISEVNTVIFLINQGANVNSRNQHGATPLHFAAIIDNVEVGKILLSNGADPKIVDFDSDENVLHTAIRWDNKNFVSLLLEHDKTLINIVDSKGNTPLHIAATRSAGVIQVLIKFGADLYAKNNCNQTPLEKAKAEYSTNVEFLKICTDKSTVIPTILIKEFTHNAMIKRSELIPEEEKFLNSEIFKYHDEDSCIISNFFSDLIIHHGVDQDMTNFLINFGKIGPKTFELLPELTKEDCEKIINQPNKWEKISQNEIDMMAQAKKPCILYVCHLWN